MFHRDSLEVKKYEFGFKTLISKELITIIEILTNLEKLKKFK